VIPHPRLGFFGVLDERLDIDLLADVADLRPGGHLVLIGPTVKIDQPTCRGAQTSTT
jgi:UDP-galactopyranose mutase